MERKLKHLEFLQIIITRMSANSFLIKGWTVTLVAALFAFAAKDSNIKYIIITYISTPLFWCLDGYYLSIERQYRALYNVVKDKDIDDIDFDLNVNSYNDGENTWLFCFFSKTLLLFYLTLIFITIIVMYLIN